MQTKEILEMRLQRLTGMEQQKIQDEFKEVTGKIAEFKGILGDPERVLDIIRQETRDLQKKYANPRRTEIVGDLHSKHSLMGSR